MKNAAYLPVTPMRLLLAALEQPKISVAERKSWLAELKFAYPAIYNVWLSNH